MATTCIVFITISNFKDLILWIKNKAWIKVLFVTVLWLTKTSTTMFYLIFLISHIRLFFYFKIVTFCYNCATWFCINLSTYRVFYIQVWIHMWPFGSPHNYQCTQRTCLGRYTQPSTDLTVLYSLNTDHSDLGWQPYVHD